MIDTKDGLIEKYKQRYPGINFEYEWESFEIYNAEVRKKKLRSLEMAWRNWLRIAYDRFKRSPDFEGYQRQQSAAHKSDELLKEAETSRPTPEALATLATMRERLTKKMSLGQ